MIKQFATVLLFAAALSSQAASFTFHAVRDNWTEVSVNCAPLPCNPILGNQSYVIGYWDFAWDSAFPTDSYSGVFGESVDCSGNFSPSVSVPGYQDTLAFTVTDPVAEVNVWISGPYPDYANGQLNFDLKRQPEGGVDLIGGGEVWIDFGPDGIGRIELVKPSDFGKWLYDGSINPNYVEPISTLKSNRGKHLGKQLK